MSRPEERVIRERREELGQAYQTADQVPILELDASGRYRDLRSSQDRKVPLNLAVAQHRPRKRAVGDADPSVFLG